MTKLDMHLAPCYTHISQTDYSGMGHVHVFFAKLGAPRAILGAPLFDMIVLLKRCRSSFWWDIPNRPVATSAGTETQHSSASAGHKCTCAYKPCLCLRLSVCLKIFASS